MPRVSYFYQALSTIFILLLAVLSLAPEVSAEEEDSAPTINLGEEYSEYKKSRPGRTSLPKKQEHSILHKTLMYLPNRVLDLFDIVKFDVGVGPALGAVVRVSRYGQVGLRTVAPLSVRAGLRGRKVPVFLESSSEFGIGPAFVQSKDRTVGYGEVGAGADLLLAGAYLGVDFAEIGDFILGIAGFGLFDDDI